MNPVRVLSRDLSAELSIAEDPAPDFQKLLKEFLGEVALRVEGMPVKIDISVETKSDMWRFVAEVAYD